MMWLRLWTVEAKAIGFEPHTFSYRIQRMWNSYIIYLQLCFCVEIEMIMFAQAVIIRF